MRRDYFPRCLLASLFVIALAATVHAQPSPPPDQAELLFWETIRNSTNRADFEEYLKQYPDGKFSGLARNRIQGLEKPAGGIHQAPATTAINAMDFLPGLWEAQLEGNRYRMSVAWNPSANQFEGTLTSHGVGSRSVGFTIGEVVWKARQTDTPNRLTETQMWRSKTFGVSRHRWIDSEFDLSRATKDEFATSFVRFRRVENR